MHEAYDYDAELEVVRSQVRDNELFSPAVTAMLDTLRASVHERLRQRGLDPTSSECEHVMVVAGGMVGQLLASPDTTAMLAGMPDDEQRGGLAALLFWQSSISPHSPSEAMP